jgi:hypothetical protein
LTSTTDYPGGGTGFRVNTSGNPALVRQYCNGSKVPPEAGFGAWYTVPPGTNESNVPIPLFSLTAGATVDEGNNWINISWGPLSLINPATEATPAAETTLGDYSIGSGSSAIDYITNANSSTTYAAAPATDFFGTSRKANNAVDVGAVEFTGTGGGGTGNLSVTGGPLAFGNQNTGTTSAARTLTLTNGTAAGVTGITVTVATTSTPTTPNQFARPGGAAGGTCGGTLAAGASCTINIVFSPTSAGAKSGTVTIAASAPVSGSPVVLSGTGVAGTPGASLTPTTWSPTATRGIGALGPIQIFTLTNTGTGTLTGIGQGSLGGINAGDYFIVRLASTCGPAGGGQLLGSTTLAPGASCVVTVQFRPLATDPAGSVRNATVMVTDAVGTQTSTLSGTAK